MRRRHVDEARLAAAAHPRLDVEALGVDAHRDDPGAGPDEGAAGARIAGILHPASVPRVEQQAADEIEALLGAGHDDDLVGLALRAPRAVWTWAAMASRSDAKAGRLAVVELRRRDGAQAAVASCAQSRTGNRSRPGVPMRNGRGGPPSRRAPVRHRRQGGPAARQRADA